MTRLHQTPQHQESRPHPSPGVRGVARRAVVCVGLALAAAGVSAIELPLPPPPFGLPGLPGRVDVSRLPVPQVVLRSPVIITPPALPAPRPGVVVSTPPPRAQPVYLWVPPGHRKHWSKHCHRYQACGHPVYFVRDDWYDRHVHKGAKHKDDDDRAHGQGKGDGKGGSKGHDKGKD